MSHQVETMAYSGEVPWHGLGNPIGKAERRDPLKLMKVAGCDWTVSKRPVFFNSKGSTRKFNNIPGEFALVRDSDERVLSMVGSNYKPVQNRQAFEFFADFCKAGRMTMETGGSLWNGRYVWVLARLHTDFAVVKDTDEMRPYLLLMSPHSHGKALIMQYTAVRVVCWNTLQLALGGENLRGSTSAFRMPHSQNFVAKKDEAVRVLNLTTEMTDRLQRIAAILARRKAAKDQVSEFFNKVIGAKPDAKKTPVLLPKLIRALQDAPGAHEKTAEGTWWGAFNAVTYVVDHDMGNDRQTALKNAWVGEASAMKRNALDLALEMAG